jgi:hypothetical protein
VIDFDDIDNWAPALAVALRPLIPKSAAAELVTAAPAYLEDARDILFRIAGREAVIDSTLAWIRSNVLAGYHGTRLTNSEVESVRSNGLIPLVATARKTRLTRALSVHPRWDEVKDQLDLAISEHGAGGKMGVREQQVHLTLSRAGLTESFNHYMTHGSEFDQRVAYALLGKEGVDLLALDGKPRVVQVAVPGSKALEAAHPFFDIPYMRSVGDVPNLVNEFLEAWSYRTAYPGYQSRRMKVDCGIFFRETVAAKWISRIEEVELKAGSAHLNRYTLYSTMGGVPRIPPGKPRER